jgi:hypothetical protein
MKQAALILKRSEILLFVEGVKTPYGASLPPEVFFNLELADQSLLLDPLSQTLSSNSIKPHQCLILVAKDLLYEKEFGNREISEVDIRDFLSLVPVEESSLVHVVVKGPSGISVSVLNSNLVKPLLSFLTSKKWSVEAVIPETILGSGVNFSLLDLNVLKEGKKYLLSADFKAKIPMDSPEKGTLLSLRKFFSGNSKYFKIAFSILGIIVVPLVMFVVFKDRIIPSRSTSNTVEPQILINTDVPTSLESSESSQSTQSITQNSQGSDISQPFLSKSALRITVLNGTATPGLASRTKNLIAPLSFIQVTTGNAPIKSQVETLIKHSPNVNPAHLIEIEQVLSAEFEKVSQPTVATFEELGEGTDIYILLGSPK